jgi:hypothetical protein
MLCVIKSDEMKNIKNFKYLILIIGIFINSFNTFGQINLSSTEKETLKIICNQYNVSLKESPVKIMKDTCSVKFTSFIEQMIVIKDKPKKIVDIKFLKKPSHDDLIFWYIVREFHSNNQEPDSLKKHTRQDY